jgi:endonuclease YncB( thermonuclease family)
MTEGHSVKIRRHLLAKPKNNYIFQVKPVRVIDGDTFRCTIELPFYLTVEMDCRIAGINSIELADPGGPEAKQALADYLYGADVVIQSIKPDKYSGRFDADVFVLQAAADTGYQTFDVGKHLIQMGFAVPWDGKGPKPKPVWPRVNAGPVN